MFKSRVEKLKSQLAKDYPHLPQHIHTVISPLRICPLGAHIDHQNGPVTGMPVGEPNILVFMPTTSPEVRIKSCNFEGEVVFNVTDELVRSDLGWENYAKGAAKALNAKYPITRGFVGVIEGVTPVGGLSSSASVGIAYLLALEKSNQLDLSPHENIQLDKDLENGFLGLKNGILDQSIILMGNKRCLTFLDCKKFEFTQITQTKPQDQYEVIIAYSGLSKSLVSSADYNNRVNECLEAASILSRRANLCTTEVPKLGDVPYEIWHDNQKYLPTPLNKRAAHFYTETKRVLAGADYWKQGDIKRFGNLMNESCTSSIENYESGSPHLISLHTILKECRGVYGSRFSGAGFRGSCIGFIDPKYKQEIVDQINRIYPYKHPEVASEYKVLFTKQLDGVRVY